jgi:hypothetical protein
MSDNTKRFLIHLGFAGAAAVATFVVQNIGLLNLGPSEQAIVVALASSAASFFRTKEQ